METRLTPPARLDAVDRELFKNVLESEPFRMIQSRIAEELKRAEETCVRADRGIELRRAQGAANALRTALKLPRLILDEMTSRKPHAG